MNPSDPFPEGSAAGPERSPVPVPRTARRGRGDMMGATVHLTARDATLILLLDEHRTLTTEQITAVAFDSRATATSRLYRLRRARWLDRFDAVRPGGRLGIHWVTGDLGSRWAALRQGRAAPTTRTARDRREAIAAARDLQHTDGTNQVFVDLLTHARHHPGTRLARWWSPARTAAAAGQRIHPDGHGVWEEHDPGTDTTTQVGFWLEYDTGTEALPVLVRKLEPYRRLAPDGPAYPVLLWLPNPTRETNFHRKLNGQAAHLGITVATTTAHTVATHPDGPTGPVWKVAGNGRTRHRLAALPSHHGPHGAPYHPGPPTPDDDPLHLIPPPAVQPHD